MAQFLKVFNLVLVHISRVGTALIAAGFTWLVAHALVGGVPVLPLLAAGAAFWWTMRYLIRPSRKRPSRPSSQ